MQRHHFLKLVHEVKEDNDVTIISITHDLDEVIEADNVIVMNNGTVFKQGPLKKYLNIQMNLLL